MEVEVILPFTTTVVVLSLHSCYYQITVRFAQTVCLFVCIAEENRQSLYLSQ